MEEETSGVTQSSETARKLAQARVSPRRKKGLFECLTTFNSVTQALDEALEEHHRMEASAAQLRLREDEEGSKEDIIRRMGKKLKVAKEEDDGIVDLTLDDE